MSSSARPVALQSTPSDEGGHLVHATRRLPLPARSSKKNSAAQSEQLPEALWECHPSLHAEQEEAPGRLRVPGAQPVHVVDIAAAENFPAAQSTHCDAPVTGWCLPTAQSTQLLAPVLGANVPLGHAWHTLPPVAG